MTNPDPIIALCDRLSEVIDDHKSVANCARIIGAETDESLSTVRARLDKWQPDRLPESIVKLARDLEFLGYRLTVEPTNGSIASPSIGDRVEALERRLMAHLSNDHGVSDRPPVKY